ncbi:MAG TPA: flagellar basal-body rod protein FlgG [Symbiobacteriaceae bacterium]|nr:flagellar basal-body rod protein FlgG [Symbiobacteriaceae bacterium]
MLRALFTAASGMVAQQVNIDAISHNLANVNTTGFKKGRAEFQDLLYTQILPPARGENQGIVVGQGVRLSSIHRIMNGGTRQVSGGDYDVAISGGGYFQVRRPDGSTAYTRDGAFHLDADRHLVTAQGDLVLGEDGPITIPPGATEVSIGADGTVSYTDTAKSATNKETAEADGFKQATVTVGRIVLATFPNPAGLEALGDNLWGATAATGDAVTAPPGDKDAGRLVQGYLEGSNVQSVEEMVNLIMAQRAYEINSKVVQSADEMMSLTNNLRRG